MNPDVLKYLQDILDSINKIEQHLLATVSLSAFSANPTVTDAVERRLGIIGEALAKAHKIDPNVEVTDIKKIIGLRHILVHDYDLIDDPTIWKICKISLPVLKEEVSRLINQSTQTTG